MEDFYIKYHGLQGVIKVNVHLQLKTMYESSGKRCYEENIRAKEEASNSRI
jgi:hypothetical protein